MVLGELLNHSAGNENGITLKIFSFQVLAQSPSFISFLNAKESG
jgi:hypothetical protein